MTSIKGYNIDTRDFEYVRMDNTGLLISGGSSGEGGDASSNNQVLQLNTAINSNLALFNQLSTQTDRILYDTDLIYNQLVSSNSVLASLDVSCNNIEVVLGNYTFTSGNLHVRDDRVLVQQQSSNIAQFGKLELIEQGTEISSGYLQSIDTLITPIQHGIAKYTLDAKSTLAPDTVPAYSDPPSGIPSSEGWYYKNLVLGNNSQLYYYANQSSQTRNHDYTISAIQSQWAVVRILSLNSATGSPFLVVYSQPEGDGDHIPGFARSSWVYEIASSAELRLSEKIIIYRGIPPDVRIFPELRRVECVLSVTRGPGLMTEKLAYATVNTDSGAAVGNAEYIISGAGLTFTGDHVYKVELTSESVVVSGDASSSNQLSSNLAVCSRLDVSNTTLGLIKTNLDQLTYSGSNLHVRDFQVSSEISSLNSTIGQGISVNMDTDPAVSGGVKLHGSTDGNLFVYDASANTTLGLIMDELITLNGVYTELISGTEQLSVSLDANDGVSLYAYNPTTLMPEPLTLSIDSGMKALDVHVVNQPSGYATESTLADISENLGLTQFNVSGLTTCNTNDVYISNFPSIQGVSLLGETISAAISGTVDVNVTNASLSITTTSALDTNITNNELNVLCFGSSNGNNHHRLKTNNQGVLETSISNAVSVQNSSGTQLAVKNTDATAIVTAGRNASSTKVADNQPSVNGPVQIGASVDTNGYLYVNAYITVGTVVSGGQVHLEFSPDGTVWARAFYSAFFNTGSNQTAYINVSSPLPWRYVRLFADSGIQLATVTAYISMK